MEYFRWIPTKWSRLNKMYQTQRKDLHDLVFIRPSLDGTYYGMALSVRPSVCPSVRLLARKNIDANSGFLAATKQLYKWYFPSVRPSVCLSVCPSVRHTFLTMFPSSYHHEIFRSYYQWQKWRPCKRSRSEVKGQGHRGHNPTLPFPDCNSSLNSRMMMKWCIQLGSA